MKSRKLYIVTALLAMLVAFSMVGTGIAAATGALGNWSGSATYTVRDSGGTITVTTQSGSWVGDTLELGTVDAGVTYYGEVTVANTHTHSVTVKATETDNGPSSSQWYYWDGANYVSLSSSGTTLSAGGTLWLKLAVTINSGASEGAVGSVTIGITAD